MTTAAPVYSHPTNPGFAEFLSSDTMLLPGGLTLPTFTPGSVIFAGTGGALAQDNDKLFFDATNFALGVGTASPGVNTVSIVQPVKTTGSPIALKVTGGAHTTLTLSTEAPDVFLALARTVQFATGAIATQRGVLVDQPTYAFVGASNLTDAATIGIVGAPVEGANATIASAHGLLISAGAVGTPTASYGATINAQTGGATNVGAQVVGGSGANGTVLYVAQAAATAQGNIRGLVYTGSVNTNQTLSTEIQSIYITTAGREWATGALAKQREVEITAPTYSFVGASTITDAITFGVDGAPIKGANATLTNTHAVYIGASAVVGGGASYGLTCNAQSGATTNYSAQFLGGSTAGVMVNPGTTPMTGLWLDIAALGVAGTRNSHWARWRGHYYPAAGANHTVDINQYVYIASDAPDYFEYHGLSIDGAAEALLYEVGHLNAGGFWHLLSGIDDWYIQVSQRSGSDGAGKDLYVVAGAAYDAGANPQAGGVLYLHGGNNINAGTEGQVVVADTNQLLGFFGTTPIVRNDANPFTLNGGASSWDLPSGGTTAQVEQCLRQLLLYLGETAGLGLCNITA